MTSVFHQNTACRCRRLFLVGTRWRRSNGSSESLSPTDRSTATIKRSTTHFGKGEGTTSSSFRFQKYKSKPRSRSRATAKLFRQIQTCAFMARRGRAMAKLRKSKLVATTKPLGTKQNCSANQNRTRGASGNGVGKHPLVQAKQRSLRARPIQTVKHSRLNATRTAART